MPAVSEFDLRMVSGDCIEFRFFPYGGGTIQVVSVDKCAATVQLTEQEIVELHEWLTPDLLHPVVFNLEV